MENNNKSSNKKDETAMDRELEDNVESMSERMVLYGILDKIEGEAEQYRYDLTQSFVDFFNIMIKSKFVEEAEARGKTIEEIITHIVIHRYQLS